MLLGVVISNSLMKLVKISPRNESVTQRENIGIYYLDLLTSKSYGSSLSHRVFTCKSSLQKLKRFLEYRTDTKVLHTVRRTDRPTNGRTHPNLYYPPLSVKAEDKKPRAVNGFKRLLILYLLYLFTGCASCD